MTSKRSRSRSEEPSKYRQLPHNAEEISVDHYFQKSAEFRIWLKDEKGKYFDELTGEKARSYFRKFVKSWNRGKLQDEIYDGIDPSTQAASTHTAFKWSFAKNRSKVDGDSLKAVRESVGNATNSGLSSGSGTRVMGPTLPSSSDMIMAREAESEYRSMERELKRKRDRMEAKDRVEEMVGPKEVGREGMLEKKRAKRDNDRAFRDKGDDGFEADESTLIGTGDSFKDQIARRDAARKRFEDKRGSGKAENVAAGRERVAMIKDKEKATMDMFQQLAKQRFG